MSIALHGGLFKEMIYGLAGGFVIAVFFFIFIHYRVYKSGYYNEEYVYFSSGKKTWLYLGFLLVNLFAAWAIFFGGTLILTRISSYFIKNF